MKQYSIHSFHHKLRIVNLKNIRKGRYYYEQERST